MKEAANNNPYIGLRAYEETDAAIFRGRTRASADLFRLITDNDVVVLHAESGEGKSSLLNAGLSPILRDERYFPIKINFTEEDFDLNEPDFDKIVFGRIMESIAAVNGHTQREDFFRESSSFDGQISLVPVKGSVAVNPEFKSLRENIWCLLRNYTLDFYGAALTPVLIFDQFEEVFTRSESISWTEDFFLWLSRTLNDDIPENVVAEIRKIIGAEADFPKLLVEKRFKALFSLRTEYMGEIDYWAIQRHHISVMKNSRFCLKPLTEEEADTVLALQPAFTDETREKIKRAISNTRGKGRPMRNLPMIPAMLLSVVSTTASANIGKGVSQSAEVNSENTGADTFIAIVSQFYRKEISDSGIPRGILKQIEDVLVDDKGKRVRIKADAKELQKIDFLEKYKPLLEQKRLIKSSQLNGDEYVELVHDAIARVIDRKRVEKAASLKTAGALLLNSIWLLLIVLFLTAVGRCIIDPPAQLRWTSFMTFLYIVWYWPIRVALFCIAGIIGFGAYKSCLRVDDLWKKAAIILLFYLPSFWMFEFIFAFLQRSHISSDWWNVRLILFAAGSVLTFIGGYYIWYRKIWIKIAGAILLYIGCLPAMWKFLPVFWIVLGFVTLFFVTSFLMAKDRNFFKCSLLTIAVLIGFYFLRASYNPLLVFLPLTIMIIILGLLTVVSFKWPNQMSSGELKDFVVKGKAFSTYPIVRPTFYISIAVILIFFSVQLGNYLLPTSVFWLPVIAVLCLWCIYKAFPLVAGKTLLSLAVVAGVVTLFIGLSQFFAFHGFFIVTLWIVSLGLFFYLISSKSGKLERKRTVTSLISWVICIIALPFVILGNNLLPLNDTYRVWGAPLVISYGPKLMIIKNRFGDVGLRDRAGNIVIPTAYDRLYMQRDGSSDSRTVAFLLEEDGIFSAWFPFDHLTERNALTDFYVKNYDDYFYNWNSDFEEARKKYRTLRARNDDYLTSPQDIEFIFWESFRRNYNQVLNYSQKAFDADDIDRLKKYFDGSARNDSLTFLKKVPYNEIDLSIIPFASHGFNEKVFEFLIPNLGVYPFGTVADVLDDNFNPEDEIYSDSIATFVRYNSEQADPQEAKRFIAGDVYQWLGNLYMEAGEYSLANEWLKKALSVGKFNEPALVDFYLSALLICSSEKEKEDIIQNIFEKQNDLIRINTGLHDYPDPNLDGAWKYLRYNTLHNLLNQRVEDLHGVISNQEYATLRKVMDNLPGKIDNRLYNNSNLPFDFIQKLPSEGDGVVLRYFSFQPCGNTKGLYGNGHVFYYYVKDGELISPTFGKVSYPVSMETSYSDPVLFIDYITKKRRYMKNKEYIFSDAVPEVMEGEYDHAWPFSEGLAAVEVDGKIGFIDTRGKMVIKPQFSPPFRPFTMNESVEGWMLNIYRTREYKTPYFKDGVAPVYDSNNQLIHIDRQGKKIQ